jgi:phenylalanyl-tRNA synthetase alpha subunit
MASSADIQAQIDSLNDKISNLSGGMGGAGVRTTYQNQIRNLQTQLNAARQAEERQQQEQQPQQQEQPQQQQEQPQQQTTPISQVAPQAAGNQLPTLKQSIIDEQFKNKRTNELTSFNSDIRDKIVDAGWNEKSDAVRILNGSGV